MWKNRVLSVAPPIDVSTGERCKPSGGDGLGLYLVLAKIAAVVVNITLRNAPRGHLAAVSVGCTAPHRSSGAGLGLYVVLAKIATMVVNVAPRNAPRLCAFDLSRGMRPSITGVGG